VPMVCEGLTNVLFTEAAVQQGQSSITLDGEYLTCHENETHKLVAGAPLVVVGAGTYSIACHGLFLQR